MMHDATIPDFFVTSHVDSADSAVAHASNTKMHTARRQIMDLVVSINEKKQLLSGIARVIDDFVHPEGIAYWVNDGLTQHEAQLEGLVFPFEGMSDELQQHLINECKEACQEGTTLIRRLTGPPEIVSIVTPILVDCHPIEAMLVFLSPERPSLDTETHVVELTPTEIDSWHAHPVTHIVELAATEIGAWHAHRRLLKAERDLRQTAELVELIARVQTCRDLNQACATLVNELKIHLGCRQAVLGLCHKSTSSCKVHAISDLGKVDRNSDLVQSLEAALDESIVRGKVTMWPPENTLDRHAMLAHKRLLKSTAARNVVSSPIRDEDGDIQGVWLFLDEAELPDGSSAVNFLMAAEQCLGSCLKLLKRAERSRLQRLVQTCTAFVKGRKIWAAALVVAAIMGILCLPVSYKVKCRCDLRPVTRRYVAAPFDVTLAKSHVEPGDIVESDQLLAELDGRELRWELAGVVADHNRAAKERDSHLAKHEFGEAQLSKFEMERLELKIQLLNHRSDHLQVRSPIDGIVVAGDLKKAEGVPLSVGETLFEVAPLDRMIVEVAIPEEDIAYVSNGLDVRITLDAYPSKEWSGILEKIHPRAEVVDNEHVFIGEVFLENSYELLHPGMRGRAKINCPDRPLGWNLFHKPWEKLTFWVGW